MVSEILYTVNSKSNFLTDCGKIDKILFLFMDAGFTPKTYASVHT